MEKLKIKYPIIVEGKYDKIKISSVADAFVLTTEGFGVFRREEKLAVIKKLAEKNPIIILTDSDGAGKLIRSHICSAIPRDRLIQLYVPQVRGRERRKHSDSAEGYLGVEGMDADVIRNLLLPFADACISEECPADNARADVRVNACKQSPEAVFKGREITKADFYEDGLTGKDNSADMRDRLCVLFGLPAKMTSSALLQALRVLCTFEEYKSAVREISTEVYGVNSEEHK